MATATIRLSLLALLFTALSFGGQKHATSTGAGAHTGMDVSNAWSFAEAMYVEVGDTVNFHTGSYPYIFYPENSGTASQPIVFRAYGSDVVTFTGASDSNPDVVYFPGAYVELWNVNIISGDNVAYDGDYVISMGGNHNVLHGCDLIHGGNIQTEYLSNNYRTRGISLFGQYNTIDSCWVRGMTEGIVLSGTSPRYHKIRWNRVHNTVNNGIICGGSNDGTTSYMAVLIQGNNVDSCGEDNIQFQPGTDPYSYDKNKGYIIRENYLARAYENAIDRKGAAFVVVENNIIHTANSDDDGWVNGSEDWGTGPLIERGNPETINEYYCLDRGNAMWDGPGGITMSHGGQFINNLMANNRRKLTVSNTSDSTEDALKDINLEGSSTTRSVLNNILIGQPNHSYVWLWNMETSPLDIDNQLYFDTTGTLRFYYRLSGGTSAKVYGLSAWQSRLNTTYTSFTGRDAHAISSNPLFVNFPFRPYSYNASWDWSLDAGSPAIGAARCWTFASGAGSPSTSLVVDNPYVFTDGFGIVQGDSIDIDGDVRRITSINYSTSTITLSSGASWSDNDSVWFYTAGARVTNLGPYANVTTVVDTGGDPGGAPATPTALTPANGSTRTSPVTFSWSRSSGAVNYWLCVSPDNWGTLIVDQAAITDTFYTANLTGGGSYVWNVSAANAYGRSGWTGDWTFSTATPSNYRDTLTLSWDIVSHNVTIDTNSVIRFSDVQRVEIVASVHNQLGFEVTWLGVTWKTVAPPTVLPADSWFRFYWVGGDTVYGAYMSALGSTSTTWSSIVGDLTDNAALANVLGAKADSNSIPLFDSTGFATADSAAHVIAPHQGRLKIVTRPTGGSGSGDIDGVTAGYGIAGGGTSGTVTVRVDTTKFTPVDTLGFAGADTSTQVLAVQKGRVKLATRPSGGVADHGALTGLSDNDHPQYALRADSTTWLMTKTRLDLMLAGYLPTSGGSLSGPISVTGSGTFSTFTRASSDSIGTSGVAGNVFSWWQNDTRRMMFGISILGRMLWRRYYMDGVYRDIFNTSTSAEWFSWLGKHEYDTLNVRYALTSGSNKVPSYTGSPSEGQILKWTSGAWVIRNDSVGTGGGGVADGQDADSLMGKRLDTLGRDLGPGKLSALTFNPDSAKYKHVPIARLDTAGYWRGKNVVIDTANGGLVVELSTSSVTDYVRQNSDTWYSTQHGNMAIAPATQALVASRIRAFPFVVTRPYSIDSVRFEVSTGVAGCNVALGLYLDTNGDLYPDSLALALGAYTCAAAAVKGDTVTVGLGSTSPNSYTFRPNQLYFVAWHSNSTATLRAVPLGGQILMFGHNSAMGASTQYTCWSATSTYTYPNACPATFPAGGAYLANSQAPLILWRVKP